MASSPTFADVTRALARHSERTSKNEANQVLESVAGTTSLRDVDPSLFASVIAALDAGVDEDDGDVDVAAETDSSPQHVTGALPKLAPPVAPVVTPMPSAAACFKKWNSHRKAPRDE